MLTITSQETVKLVSFVSLGASPNFLVSEVSVKSEASNTIFKPSAVDLVNPSNLIADVISEFVGISDLSGLTKL